MKKIKRREKIVEKRKSKPSSHNSKMKKGTKKRSLTHKKTSKKKVRRSKTHKVKPHKARVSKASKKKKFTVKLEFLGGKRPSVDFEIGKFLKVNVLVSFIVVAIILFFIVKLIITGGIFPTVGNWDKVGILYNCTTCADCTSAIADASGGDVVYLNTSIDDATGTCIDFAGKDNIIFDCSNYGNYIDGDDSGSGSENRLG